MERLLFWFILLTVIGTVVGDVSYDGRSLIINGQRKILFSGSIHYARSTPEMWPSLIAKAKDGGIDVIQTYVFWNIHEPQPGQYDFSGRHNIVGFIKEIQSQGLYASLRIGPFIESEWTNGGLPFWLHDIPGIVYRSNNEPFKFYMQNFTTKIVNMMQSESLYASQGGPIIISQIENEYQEVEGAFGKDGPPYLQWAADMAVGLQTGVPWMMCKQDNAPDPVINACNGKSCGETFAGPNSPNKPSIWAENWTTKYQIYGDKTTERYVEDIAFQVALFIARNGSFVNYYMYSGGTNFGRKASAFVITSYYDLAPLDEYGMLRQPKWGHLKELHAAVKLCSEPLLSGIPPITLSLGQQQKAYEFHGNSSECAVFLVNNDTRQGAEVFYRNSTYDLPPKSISILPDCKDVAFNTAKVSTQTNSRSMIPGQKFDAIEMWEEFKEAIPNFEDTPLKSDTILEQTNTTKDTSDYLWYTFSFQYNSSNTQASLNAYSLGHVLLAFVNGVFVGSVHKNFTDPSVTLESTISLINGINNVSFLSVMVGLPDSGPHLESKYAGLRSVSIQDNQEGTIFTNYTWGYQVGLQGDNLQIFADQGLSNVQWSNFSSPNNSLTWYKTLFDAPAGDEPVALNLGSMGKGEAWINGQSIGRYWVSFLTPEGSPSQTWYHVPNSFLNTTSNLLVILEEEGGNPLQISLDTVSITEVCGQVTNSHMPPVKSWKGNDQSGKTHKIHHGRKPRVQLDCPVNKKISKIIFASFGTPSGNCETYAMGSCHSSNSKTVVEEACLGKQRCSIPKSNQKFGGDPCPNLPKALLVVAQCT